MSEQTTPPNPQEQAVALAKSTRTTRDLLKSDEFANAVKAGLPKHLTVDRFVRIALNATMRQPALLDCTKESLFLRMLELSALGIEPDGRRAHLIPFNNNSVCGLCLHPKDKHRQGVCMAPGCKSKSCGGVPSAVECSLIVDYKGLAELVRRSGDVSYMHCDVVYGGDEWSFEYGSKAHLHHKPDFAKQDRKLIIAIYSYVKLRDGNEDFIVMSPREVEDVRAMSKYPNGGPWVKTWGEMSKKTVFRRHSKWLPLSAEVRDAVEADDDNLDIDGAFTVSSENVRVDLEDQMQEQGEAVRREQEQKQEGKTEEGTAEKVADADHVATGEPPSLSGNGKGLWPNRANMIAAFTTLKDLLGDVMYYPILSGSGVGSDEDDLGLHDPATAKAYAELQAKAAELARERSETHGPDEPDFTPKGRGRNR